MRRENASASCRSGWSNCSTSDRSFPVDRFQLAGPSGCPSPADTRAHCIGARAGKRAAAAIARIRATSARATAGASRSGPAAASAHTLVQTQKVQDGDTCLNKADCGEEDEDGSDIPGGQAETSIAVDESGQHIVVGYNDTRGLSRNPISVSGVLYSEDGGQTCVD